jgi:hypothetical protein
MVGVYAFSLESFEPLQYFFRHVRSWKGAIAPFDCIFMKAIEVSFFGNVFFQSSLKFCSSLLRLRLKGGNLIAPTVVLFVKVFYMAS